MNKMSVMGVQACTHSVQALEPVRLAYKLSTPRVLSIMGFWFLGFGLGHLLGFVVLGAAGPLGFGLIFYL